MLNECKDISNNLCVKKGWDEADIKNVWMFLIEEIGELASAVRRTSHKFVDKKKVSVEGEVMDVLSYLFQIALMYNIDLDKALSESPNITV